nr:unnamed protein product [Callosobruchus analis]
MLNVLLVYSPINGGFFKTASFYKHLYEKEMELIQMTYRVT